MVAEADKAPINTARCPSCGRLVEGEEWLGAVEDGAERHYLRYVCRQCPAVREYLGGVIDIVWYKLPDGSDPETPEITDLPLPSDLTDLDDTD